MQAGSLVELVNDKWDFSALDTARGVVYPVKQVIYTVRAIVRNDEGKSGVRLEEIINPILPYGSRMAEKAFRVERFRELQPPMDMELVKDLQHYNLVKDLF
jgi:hypothetical protein